MNSISFRHSSRSFPLKLSTNVFWVGLPGAVSCSSTRRSFNQRRIAMLVSSVPPYNDPPDHCHWSVSLTIMCSLPLVSVSAMRVPADTNPTKKINVAARI